MPELIEKIVTSIILNDVVSVDINNYTRFKNGEESPIYCDFRVALRYPVLRSFIKQKLLEVTELETTDRENITIAGVQTGGLIYAAFIADTFNLPFVYIDDKAKNKGYGKIDWKFKVIVKDKVVYLFDDVASSAETIIKDAEAYIAAGARKVRLFTIFSYNFGRAKNLLEIKKFKLKPVLTVNDLLPTLKGALNIKEYTHIEEWIKKVQ